MLTIELRSNNKIHSVLVDDEDYVWLMKHRWHMCNGYASKTFGKKDGYNPRKRINMHRLIMNCPDDLEIDHINRNRLDNRKQNLRICDRSTNIRNRGDFEHKNKKNNYLNGLTGIHFNKVDKKWDVRVFVNSRQKHLARFKNKNDALIFLKNWAINNM